MAASSARARDRQLPAIEWAIIGAGIAGGLLTASASIMVMLGDSAGQDTSDWWSPYLMAPPGLAVLVGLVAFVAASVSRKVTVRTASMWLVVAADTIAAVWIGVDAVRTASAQLDVYTTIGLGGGLAAATTLTVPVLHAVHLDRSHARQRLVEAAELAEFLGGGED